MSRRVCLLAGLRETLAVAKSRGYLKYSLNAALVRDQFSIFQNLRQRGQELLEIKRIEYLHHAGLPFEVLENDPALLGKLYTDLDVDALMENHNEETSTLLRARIVEAILGELDYAIRTESQVDPKQCPIHSYASMRDCATCIQDSEKQLRGQASAQPAAKNRTIEDYLMNDQIYDKLFQAAGAHGSGVGSADFLNNFATPRPYGSSIRQKDTHYSFGGGFDVAPSHQLSNYSDMRLMWYLLSELVKTILRLENAKPNDANQMSPKLNTKKESLALRNAIDLEFFQNLHKGSVLQCFKRVHLLNDRKVRNTIRKAIPKLSKLRQITFSSFMHVLCDVRQLTIYREETLRNAEEMIDEFDNIRGVTSPSKAKQRNPEMLKMRKDVDRLYGKLETQEFEETKSELFTTKRSITNPFHLTAHAHKELACLVINSFLSCADVAEFHCSNSKMLSDFRRSPFLSHQQKEMLCGRLTVDAVEQKDFSFGRFMHLEEWVPPPYRRKNVNLPGGPLSDPRPVINPTQLQSKHAQRSYNWEFTPRSRKAASGSSRFNRGASPRKARTNTGIRASRVNNRENIDPGMSVVTNKGRSHSPGTTFGRKPKSSYLNSLKADDVLLCDVDLLKSASSYSGPQGHRRQPMNSHERRLYNQSDALLQDGFSYGAGPKEGGSFDNAVLIFKNMAM